MEYEYLPYSYGVAVPLPTVLVPGIFYTHLDWKHLESTSK